MQNAMTAIRETLLTVFVWLLPVAMIAWLVALSAESGVRPMRRLHRFICAFPPLERGLLAVFVSACVLWGALKPEGDGPPLNSPRCAPRMLLPGEAVGDGSSADFRIVDFHTTPSSVVVNAVWSADAFAAPPFVEWFVRTNLLCGAWESLGWVQADSGSTNVCVEIPNGLLPDPAARAAFFAACAEDALGPDDADDDGDGLSNGAEVSLGTNPHRRDSDRDGIDDGDESGYIQVLDDFVWHDTSAFLPAYNTGYWHEETGLSGWSCASASRSISSMHVLSGLRLTYLTAFETGYIAFSAVGDPNVWTFPWGPSPLDQGVRNYGSFMVAAYWNQSYLYKNDTNSFIRAGTVADGSYVVEFHGVRQAPYSPLGMTYQVIVPPGTGDVVRVSYLSSDYWMDGEGAVVGIQNSRAFTTNGYYNLTWDFSERGPILPRTTVEYHLGHGTSPSSDDSDGDGLDDGAELSLGTSPTDPDTDGDGLADGAEVSLGTNPHQRDTDEDGLPDGWEAQYGLDPLSNIGNDGAQGDFDGDGLLNADEHLHGTNPADPDTDGDGLSDLRELGGVTTNSLPWLEFESCTNLTAGCDRPNGLLVTWPLPEPIYLHGVCVTEVTIDSNGLVYFIRRGGARVEWSQGNESMMTASRTLNDDSFTVAPYWDNLYLTTAEPASAVSAGTAVAGTNRCLMIQYDGVCPNENSLRQGETNAVSWQLVVPFGDAGRIYVRYSGLQGTADGRGASIGFQDFGGVFKASYCHHEQGKIADGTAFAFAVGVGTDPLAAETYGDGLSDYAVYLSQVDPSNHDADGDGMPDCWEAAHGLYPLDPSDAELDADEDGMPNGWEVMNGLDPFDPSDAVLDEDEDGLSALDEHRCGTDPAKADTDGDGLDDGYEDAADLDPTRIDSDSDGIPDKWEVDNGLDPLDSSDAALDADGDSLSNLDEYLNDTNPGTLVSGGPSVGYDTDGDGVSDRDEIRNGSDPNDASDEGRAPPADAFRELEFNITGDFAAWEMTIKGLGPVDRRTLRITMGGPSRPEDVPKKLRKGNSYRLTMKWLNSDGHTVPYYWYCWQAKIDGIPSSPSYRGYSNVRLDGNEILAGNGWVAENADGLLTSHVDMHDPDEYGFGGGNVAGGLTATLHVLDDPRLVPDLDGDGRIDDADDRLLAAGRQFRFWTNDDNDAASPDGDVTRGSTDDFPVNGLDWNDGHVNGRRDLVDFTPILADVSPVVQNLPTAIVEKLTFRLRHAEGAFNTVWTDLAPGQANAFQTAGRASGFGPRFADAPQNAAMERVSPSGTALPDVFVAHARTGQGVFLVEGRYASSAPLWLEAVCDDRVVCSNKVDASLSGVEAMYRWMGLRHVCGDVDVFGLSTGQPSNLPDAETTGPHYVFVHGYNVSAASARGWAAEMFKRLWQAGARAKFTAVDWYGDDSRFYVPTEGDVSPNYYANVVHAFDTAPTLATEINALTGSKVMLAHSLGNMLTCEAVAHCGLQYSKYYMLNAAVPIEAFDAGADVETNMKPLSWQRYSGTLFACNWYERFSPGDGRSSLTWRGIFAGVHDAVNCYSPTEDVLGNAPSVGAGGAWSAQELLKGTGTMHLLPLVRREGGWGFNPDHTVPLSQNGELLKTEYTDDEMVTSPPFLPFTEDWLHSTNALTAAQVAEVRDRILADGIPAQTFAVGANAVDVFGDAGNYNMDSLRNDRWPSNQDGWFHSDLKNVAFWYTYKLFQKIVKGE